MNIIKHENDFIRHIVTIKNLSNKTIIAYKSDLNDFFNFITDSKIKEISSNTIFSYFESLSKFKKLKDTTINFATDLVNLQAKQKEVNLFNGEGVLLSNIPNETVEICVVMYTKDSEGNMYFTEQKTVSITSVAKAYYDNINNYEFTEDQKFAITTLYQKTNA